jgi:hypothetical protein
LNNNAFSNWRFLALLNLTIHQQVHTDLVTGTFNPVNNFSPHLSELNLNSVPFTLASPDRLFLRGLHTKILQAFLISSAAAFAPAHPYLINLGLTLLKILQDENTLWTKVKENLQLDANK